MNEISIRNFFAATADVTWMATTSASNAELKTGVLAPKQTDPPEAFVKFWISAEIAWRWRYADLMLQGFKVSDEKVARLPKDIAEVAADTVVDDLKQGD